MREKVLRETRQEVPHSIAVLVENWEEVPPGLTRIAVTIFVEREGQKAIVIGKQGAMLKKIGTLARTESSWARIWRASESAAESSPTSAPSPRMVR